MLKSMIVRFAWIWAAIFVPIETYLSWIHAPFFSEYAVNVFGVGIMLWGALSLQKDRPYAEGLLATGWGWTTAVFWRGTNLRYWFAAQGAPLYFGRAELWLGPIFTLMAGAGLVGSLVLLVSRDRRASAVFVGNSPRNT
jgi:hypothetical protein